MISYNNMQILNKMIKIYNDLTNKDFLIAYNISPKYPLNFIEIQVRDKNFWHLLGCRICDNSISPKELYQKCLNDEDISAYLDYTHEASSVREKAETFQQIYNFVSKAKIVNLVDVHGLPDEKTYNLGIGSEIGIIGYGRKSNFLYPKSTQKRPISTIKKKNDGKIRIIIEKEITDLEYNKISFEAGKDLFAKLADQFKNIPLSSELLQLMNEYKEKIAKLPQEDGYKQIGILSKKNTVPKVKSGFIIENLQKFKNIASQIPKTDTYIIGSLREINIKEINNDTFEIELIYDDNENDDI